MYENLLYPYFINAPNKLECLSLANHYSKVGAYPSDTPFRCRWAPSLTHKYFAGLEKSAKDKHSSFLRTIVNYGSNKCYYIGPWEKFKTSFFKPR